MIDFSDYLNLFVLNNEESSVNGFVQSILNGHFIDILSDEKISAYLTLSDPVWKSFCPNKIYSFLQTTIFTQNCSKLEDIFLAAVSALLLVVQANWTGPYNKEDLYDSFFLIKLDGVSRKCCLTGLKISGCDVYDLIEIPQLFLLPRMVFQHASTHFQHIPTFHFWRVRYLLIYQQVLNDLSDDIYDMFTESVSSVQTLNTDNFPNNILVDFHLTVANLFNNFCYVNQCQHHLNIVHDLLGCKIQFLGLLGKRTHWQTCDYPQLALCLTQTNHCTSDNNDQSNSTSENIDQSAPALDKNSQPYVASNSIDQSSLGCNHQSHCTQLPRDLNLDDETRLNSVKFCNDQTDSIALSANEYLVTSPDIYQQALVLSLCSLQIRSQGEEVLRDEQLLTCTNFLLQSPRVWITQFAALFQRSRLESRCGRTVHRALAQLEHLSQCVLSDTQPTAAHRLRHFFTVSVPTKWMLQSVLAHQNFSLGMFKSALEIYKRLHLWTKLIDCYHLLNQKQHAEELVRQLIEERGGPTPELLCLLGDATGEVEYYKEAWLLSDHTCWTAVKSLGMHHFRRQEYDLAVRMLTEATALNGACLFVWRRLAFAALQVEDWQRAASAYRRCCAFEPNNFEEWNNCAKAFIHLQQYRSAYKVLREALKHGFDNWRVWDNYLSVCVKLNEIEEAMHAYQRVFQLTDGESADTTVLRRLVDCVIAYCCSQLSPADDLEGGSQEVTAGHDEVNTCTARLKRRMMSLLDEVTTKKVASHQLFRSYSHLLTTRPYVVSFSQQPVSASRTCPAATHCVLPRVHLQALRLMQRSLREATLHGCWWNDIERCADICDIIQELCDVTITWDGHDISSGERDTMSARHTLSSVRMSCAATLDKLQTTYAHQWECVVSLHVLRDNLMLAEQAVQNITRILCELQ